METLLVLSGACVFIGVVIALLFLLDTLHFKYEVKKYKQQRRTKDVEHKG